MVQMTSRSMSDRVPGDDVRDSVLTPRQVLAKTFPLMCKGKTDSMVP